jgi:hypothetical protein
LIPTNLTFNHLEDASYNGEERRKRITEKQKPMETELNKFKKERGKYYEF